jgi:multiple antibiotic resistance protein
MTVSLIELLIMLNPFALFLYLEPVRRDLHHKQFMSVIFKASVISLMICYLFFFSGEFLFNKVFRIDFESFRIFGGIIIFSYAYFFIVKGQRALIMIKENLDDLASEIALPFMVGAGTISLSILTSYRHTTLIGVAILFAAFVLNFLSIYLF